MLIFSFFSFTGKNSSCEEIKTLKTGALLIRLKTSENIINGLIQRGKKEEAEKIKHEQQKENREIAEAFKSNFAFCKVYFFNSNNSIALKNGNFKGILINVDMEVDSSFSGNNYIIGEYGKSETNKIDGFIFEDKNDQPLKSPFPFFIRLNKSGVVERTKTEMAILVNEELNSFYNSCSSQK
jgi:hypothetical protein